MKNVFLITGNAASRALIVLITAITIIILTLFIAKFQNDQIISPFVNDQYGFEFIPLSEWGKYSVEERDNEFYEHNYIFSIPINNPQLEISSFGIFSLWVITKNQWEDYSKDESIAHLPKIGENLEYVFLWDPIIEEVPEEILKKKLPIAYQDILKYFRVFDTQE